MDFSYSAAARDLAGMTRDLATSGRPLWPALAEAGVLAAALPERAGGEGYGLAEQCAILIELGRSAATVPYLPSIVAAASAIAHFGTDEQVETWAIPAARGDVVLTVAIPGALPTATPGVLSTATPDSHMAVTLDTALGARTAATPGVPSAATPGILSVPTPGVLAVATPDSAPAATTAALVLAPMGEEIALVPAASRPPDLAGRPETGHPRRDTLAGPGPEIPRISGAGWLRARLTIGACATQLGIAERALEMTASYARERVQFGRPIGSFQAVSQRLADAWIDVEALRLALWQAVCRPEPAEVATAGFWAAETGHRVLHTAVHVHGGVGIDVEYPLHRYFLAAEDHEFLLGGATRQLLDLAEVLP